MKNWNIRGVLESWADSVNPRASFRGRSGERHEAEVMMPFGISYCPPVDGSEAVVMPIHGNHNHLVVTGFTGGPARPKSEEGGIIIYSAESGHMVTLTPDGTTLITTGSGGSFSISEGGVNTNLDIVTSGDVIADGVSLKSHVHVGVRRGPSTSGEPV